MASVLYGFGEEPRWRGFALPRLQFGIAYAGKADDLIRDNVIIKLDVTAPRSARAL